MGGKININQGQGQMVVKLRSNGGKIWLCWDTFIGHLTGNLIFNLTF